eukprot:7594529-Pyramimonas_sp.AAC.1
MAPAAGSAGSAAQDLEAPHTGAPADHSPTATAGTASSPSGESDALMGDKPPPASGGSGDGGDAGAGTPAALTEVPAADPAAQ